MLTALQKSDPVVSKELAVVCLTRIYVLVQPYQTLVREIATPTIPEFTKASLQLIKPPSSSKPSETPHSVIETVCDAFSTLVPLYPTTLRPFSSQIRSAARLYFAPTSSDHSAVSTSLQRAARGAVISQHHVAAKSGGGEEWTKLIDGLLRDFHSTADQVLRAVDESWEGTANHNRTRVDLDEEPHGGGDAAEELPPWTGIASGAERLIGLLGFIADCLQHSTKSSVRVPVGALADVVARICLLARLSPKTQTWDQSLQTKAAISREEKDELWSWMPDIHMAAMQLIMAMAQRFGKDLLPLVPQTMDHLVRVFQSGMSISAVRAMGYRLLDELLPIAGPTLSKAAVEMLGPLFGACCRDLQQDAGFLKLPEKSVASNKNGKKSETTPNVDLFLQPQASTGGEILSLEPEHKAAAVALLTNILTFVPQHHLKPTIRGLLDKTAILTRSRDAMLSSVLNPYKDQRGRMYPSILPHLSQQYPHDQGLEILRSNLRTTGAPEGSGALASFAELSDQEDEEDEDAQEEHEAEADQLPAGVIEPQPWQPSTVLTVQDVGPELPIQSNPFIVKSTAPATDTASAGNLSATDLPPKRKLEDADSASSKRRELEGPGHPVSAAAAVQSAADQPAAGDEDDDDSDESVHLNMELEDDEDDEEEDDE